jgi:hypothetical protein
LLEIAQRTYLQIGGSGDGDVLKLHLIAGHVALKLV